MHRNKVKGPDFAIDWDEVLLEIFSLSKRQSMIKVLLPGYVTDTWCNEKQWFIPRIGTLVHLKYFERNETICAAVSSLFITVWGAKIGKLDKIIDEIKYVYSKPMDRDRYNSKPL